MKQLKILVFTLILVGSGTICRAQSTLHPKDAPQFVRASPAYAEVLLRRTELEAELEDLLVGHTLEFPPVIELRFKLDRLNVAVVQLFGVKSEESSKLTLALGKLMVRKADLETELWKLQKQYSDEHPEVKKAKRKILVFESAIKDILL